MYNQNVWICERNMETQVGDDLNHDQWSGS